MWAIICFTLRSSMMALSLPHLSVLGHHCRIRLWRQRITQLHCCLRPSAMLRHSGTEAYLDRSAGVYRIGCPGCPNKGFAWLKCSELGRCQIGQCCDRLLDVFKPLGRVETMQDDK